MKKNLKQIDSMDTSPAQFRFASANQKELIFRMVLAEDKCRFKEGFQLLSPESRYLRFFSYLKKLSEVQLNYLSQVDQFNHVAWGAIDPETHPELGVGVARFIRLEDCPNCAELAITVLDDYQGRGIGKRLFVLMYILAQHHEIDSFRGSVLAENQKVIKNLERMGGELQGGDQILEFELPVYQKYDQMPHSDFGKRFWDVLESMSQLLYATSKD